MMHASKRTFRTGFIQSWVRTRIGIKDCFFDMGMLGSNFEVRKLIWHVHGSVCIAPRVRIMLEIWKSSSVLNLHIFTTYIYIFIYDLYFYKFIVDTILLVCSYRYIIFASTLWELFCSNFEVNATPQCPSDCSDVRNLKSERWTNICLQIVGWTSNVNFRGVKILYWILYLKVFILNIFDQIVGWTSNVNFVGGPQMGNFYHTSRIAVHPYQ